MVGFGIYKNRVTKKQKTKINNTTKKRNVNIFEMQRKLLFSLFPFQTHTHTKKVLEIKSFIPVLVYKIQKKTRKQKIMTIFFKFFNG